MLTPTPAGDAFRAAVTEAMLHEVLASYDTLLALLAHLLNALVTGSRRGLACDAALWQHVLNGLATLLRHAGKATLQPLILAMMMQEGFAALACECVSGDALLPDTAALRSRVHALLVL